MIDTTLFDDEIYFGITFQGETFLIIEPDGFNKIINRIPRDPKWMAFWSDFLEDKYGMKFTFIKDGNKTGGGQLLRYIAETIGLGPTSEVFFEIGYKKVNTLKRIHQWRINLEEYTCQDFGSGRGYVQTSIEKMPMQGKLRSRLSVACTVNGVQNMDGELLSPITTWYVRLHSKTLLETTEGVSANPQTSNELPPTFFDTYLIIQPDQDNLTINELDQVFTQPLGIADTTSRTPAASGTPAPANGSGLDAFPFDVQVSQYSPSTSGLLNIDWSGGTVDTSFYYWKNASTNNFWTITPRVVVQRLIGGVWTIIAEYDGTTKTISDGLASRPAPTAPMTAIFPSNIATAGLAYILPSLSGSGPRSTEVIQVKGYTFDEHFTNIQVKSGDNVYVHLLMCTNGTVKVHSAGLIQVDKFINTIKYQQLTTTPQTIAPAYRAIDILNQMVESITGQKNAVKSPFLEEGGAGYNFLYTNGYGIRNFGADIYLPKKSAQEFLEDLQAQHCLGVGIKKIDNVEYLYIDEMSNFFKFRVIDTFTETFKWKKTHQSKFCYNKVELGYDKFEGLNIIQNDEFNTQGSYLLQWLTYGDNTLTKRSKTIAAGTLIEQQRRYQFTSNPGQTLTNDNDWFVITTAEPSVFRGLNVDFRTAIDIYGRTDGLPLIYFPMAMFLNPGDKVGVYMGGAVGYMEFLIAYELEGYPIYLTSPGNADKYAIQGQGDWSAGTWKRGDVVYDVAASYVYICYVNVTSATAPSADASHWVAWVAASGSWDIKTIAPSPNEVFAERNQPFEICTGVIDPATIYNGRLSMKHILYNWRPVLGVGLHYVDRLSPDYVVSRINTTLVRMNSLFTSKFWSFEPFRGNSGNQTLVENSKETVNNFLRNGTDIYSPMGATCEIKVGWNRIDTIRKALSGELGDDTKDHGGLILRDDVGDDWFCHVNDLQYDIFKEIATLQVQQVKKVTL